MSDATIALKEKPETAPSIIREYLGEHLTALYVVARNPVSGPLYDPFGLLAFVDMKREDAYEADGDIGRDESRFVPHMKADRDDWNDEAELPDSSVETTTKAVNVASTSMGIGSPDGSSIPRPALGKQYRTDTLQLSDSMDQPHSK